MKAIYAPRREQAEAMIVMLGLSPDEWRPMQIDGASTGWAFDAILVVGAAYDARGRAAVDALICRLSSPDKQMLVI